MHNFEQNALKQNTNLITRFDFDVNPAWLEPHSTLSIWAIGKLAAGGAGGVRKINCFVTTANRPNLPVPIKTHSFFHSSIFLPAEDGFIVTSWKSFFNFPTPPNHESKCRGSALYHHPHVIWKITLCKTGKLWNYQYVSSIRCISQPWSPAWKLITRTPWSLGIH